MVNISHPDAGTESTRRDTGPSDELSSPEQKGPFQNIEPLIISCRTRKLSKAYRIRFEDAVV
jgi:hypothetical protein